MRAAFVLHLFYEDIALEILDRLSGLDQRFDLLLTGPTLANDSIQLALRRLKNSCDIIASSDRGRDVGPFLDVLPFLCAKKYDLFCKLHTKRGASGYAREWREACFDRLIGSTETIDAITESFARDPELCLAGSRELYVSADRHMLGNAENVKKVARVCFPGRDLPIDWGFFAGTMFWGRTECFKPLARLKELDLEFEGNNTAVDGQLEHAVERVFGLMPLMRQARVGLLGGGGEIEIVDPSTPVSPEPLSRRLFELKRVAGERPASLARQDMTLLDNPLLHYIRNGRETDFDPNPFFHNAWYIKKNADLETTGETPLQHYLLRGAKLRRNPSPIFSTGYYLDTHANLLTSGKNPLGHYLEEGRKSGDQALPPERATSSSPNWLAPARFYRRFDDAEERAFLAMLGSLPESVRKASDDCLVSVIIPFRNDENAIADALESVLRQTHRNLEVILVGAGSSDGTANRVAPYLADARVKLVESRSGGVGAALNAGLRAASGAFIAYLEPACRWRPVILEALVTWMLSDGATCAYCVSEFSDGGRVFGYQGEQFDREANLAANYVDLNALCHARSGNNGEFDGESGFEAWGFILRYSEGRKVAFAPFVGCEHRHLTIAIKAAAERQRSNEDESARAAIRLAEAFQRLGRRARIDFRGEWYAQPVSPSEVVVAIRGPLAYEPQAGQISVLWNLSHTDQVSFEEYESYSFVHVASDSYATLLQTIVPVPVLPLAAAGEVGSSGYTLSRDEAGERSGDVTELNTTDAGSDSFDAFARSILDGVHRLPDRQVRVGFSAGTAAPRPPQRPMRMRRRRRVHIIVRRGRYGPQPSAYIRLISPLTHEAALDIELSISGENSTEEAAETDVCIVSRSALDDPERISRLVDRIRASGSRLVVDNDDAFGLIDPDDPFFELLSERNASMELLMRAADQCWFSTAPLADGYRGACASPKVIPNALDPRLWGYRPRDARTLSSADPLRLLYMGTTRHGRDLAIILPALDALAERAPGAFDMTIVGVTRALPKRPWLRRLSPPATATVYPRFVRWLCRQGPFDVGLSPLEETPFNDCKSDIKFLDYSALGLLSVVSDVPAYQGDAKNLGLAKIVKNTTEAWAAAVRAVLDDRQGHASIASAAFDYLWTERSLGGVATLQLSLLDQQ